MAPVNKLFLWNVSGIKILDALAWLNLYTHGWEYADILHEKLTEEFKQRMFRLFWK